MCVPAPAVRGGYRCSRHALTDIHLRGISPPHSPPTRSYGDKAQVERLGGKNDETQGRRACSAVCCRARPLARRLAGGAAAHRAACPSASLARTASAPCCPTWWPRTRASAAATWRPAWRTSSGRCSSSARSGTRTRCRCRCSGGSSPSTSGPPPSTAPTSRAPEPADVEGARAAEALAGSDGALLHRPQLARVRRGGPAARRGALRGGGAVVPARRVAGREPGAAGRGALAPGRHRGRPGRIRRGARGGRGGGGGGGGKGRGATEAARGHRRRRAGRRARRPACGPTAARCTG